MKAKEKAFDLFDKYMQPIDGLHKYPMCFDTAKQCALIAVVEVLNTMWEYHLEAEWWQEVKQEIENI